MIRKIISLLAVIAFAMTPALVSAQESFSLPEIYTTDVTVDTETIRPGDTVTGSFTIHNLEAATVADLSYVASLAGQYTEGNSPKITYVSNTPVSLPGLVAKNKETISFFNKKFLQIFQGLPSTY